MVLTLISWTHVATQCSNMSEEVQTYSLLLYATREQAVISAVDADFELMLSQF